VLHRWGRRDSFAAELATARKYAFLLLTDTFLADVFCDVVRLSHGHGHGIFVSTKNSTIVYLLNNNPLQ
jgi:hypothetical protein